MKKYDHDGDGEISYAEFCSAMIAKDYTDGEGLGRAHFHSGDLEAKDMSKDDAMSYFERMQALKISADRQRRLTSLLHEFALVFFSKGRRTARKAFRTFDVDNSGRVDRYEFACALKAGIGVTVNDRDIELLEEAFYGQDKEEIAYQDFIDFVRSHYVKVGQADEHR